MKKRFAKIALAVIIFMIIPLFMPLPGNTAKAAANDSNGSIYYMDEYNSAFDMTNLKTVSKSDKNADFGLLVNGSLYGTNGAVIKDLGEVSTESIPISPYGYTKDKLKTEIGHVYVVKSPSKKMYGVFQVTNSTGDSVEFMFKAFKESDLSGIASMDDIYYLNDSEDNSLDISNGQVMNRTNKNADLGFVVNGKFATLNGSVIQDMGQVNYDDITSAPQFGYGSYDISISTGDVYALKSVSKGVYAVFVVTYYEEYSSVELRLKTSEASQAQTTPSEDNVRDWQDGGAVPPNKEWKITFNNMPDKINVNSDNIYITDSKGNKISTVVEYTSGQKYVIVHPEDNLIAGNVYYLFISKKVNPSEPGSMKHSVRMKFTVSEGEVTPQVSNENIIQPVAAGYNHTLVIKSDGSLWGFGENDYGQLGNGTGQQSNVPVKIGNDKDWIAVDAGHDFSVAIKSDGTLWTWGNNLYGVLGNGTTDESLTPVQVGTDNDWAAAIAGELYILALKKDGSLWAWGNNTSGQLGIGSTEHQAYPVCVSKDKWTSIAAGSYHSLAIKSDGTLWAWGHNYNGQLGIGKHGDGEYETSPVQVGSDNDWANVTAGDIHTAAVKTDGTLWAWGDKEHGQVGDGTADPYAPVDSPELISNNGGWQGVASRGGFTFASKDGGDLYSWGYNFHGALGIKNTLDKYSPVLMDSSKEWKYLSTGYDHCVGLKYDGTVWTWGYNSYGQLGDGTEKISTSPELIMSINE